MDLEHKLSLKPKNMEENYRVLKEKTGIKYGRYDILQILAWLETQSRRC